MKYKIEIVETRTLNHTVIFETDDEDIEELLNDSEIGNSFNLDDAVTSLENEGCYIEEIQEDYDGDSEFDVDEYSEVQEN
jgi:UDP-N-acetylmuramyl pentapeptide synthase